MFHHFLPDTLYRHFNEMTSPRVHNPSSPSAYSISPTRRSLSPSPALLGHSTSTATVGFIPPFPLRGRTASYGSATTHTYNQTPSTGVTGMSSSSTSSLTGHVHHGSAIINVSIVLYYSDCNVCHIAMLWSHGLIRLLSSFIVHERWYIYQSPVTCCEALSTGL